MPADHCRLLARHRHFPLFIASGLVIPSKTEMAATTGPFSCSARLISSRSFSCHIRTAQSPAPGQERYFDTEPTAFTYSVADNFEGISFFAHDPWFKKPPAPDVLNSIKTYLAAGIPSMFGFFGFASFNNTSAPGAIPFPAPGETPIWGHAICAVGYDDGMKITNTKSNQTTTGALLIRNSWGTAWGDKGYGALPYEYVLKQYALDFWSLLGMRWIDTQRFELHD
jgi:C1A family cysteine protease